MKIICHISGQLELSSPSQTVQLAVCLCNLWVEQDGYLWGDWGKSY